MGGGQELFRKWPFPPLTKNPQTPTPNPISKKTGEPGPPVFLHLDVWLTAIAKSFFRYGKPYNPPYPPLEKGRNYKELLLKSPFEKGGVRRI
jgi:hypothetical protein